MAMNEKAEKYYLNGKKCFDNRDFEGAVNYLTKTIKLCKNDMRPYAFRGFSFFAIKNYHNAIEDFIKSIDLGANDELIYEQRGMAYLRIKNYANAIEDFTKSIDLGVNDELIYVARGSAYMCTYDYTKAIEDFTKAIEEGLNNKDVYSGRGLAYLETKDYQKAIEDLTKAIKDFKNDTNLDKNSKEENNNTGDSVYIPDTILLTDNVHDLVIDILQSNDTEDLSDAESIHLIKLICSCSDLMDEIKIKPPKVKGKQFVHYTKAGTLQYLLKKDHSAKLRLNNAVYMNDPEEGQILKRVLCQLDQNNELENLLKDTEDIKNYTYLTCFSPYDKRDELPMWIHYGDGGKGVGLVFHDSFFNKTDLYEVQYVDVKNPDIKKLNRNVRDKITAILNLLKKDDIKNNDHKEFKFYVNIILNYVSYLFKDKAYEYENEVRILNYRDYASEDINTVVSESGIPRLFIEYDECITDKNCVEVIAGPKAQYTEIAAFAKYVGISKVSQSEIKYR